MESGGCEETGKQGNRKMGNAAQANKPIGVIMAGDSQHTDSGLNYGYLCSL